MLAIHVAIATVGRPALVASTVARLARQTRRADGVLVVSVSPTDVDGVDAITAPPRIAFAERGLCRQRNRALDLLRHDADIIVFFDDDFIPADDYLESIERLFMAHPDVVGITGDLVADGIGGPGFTVDEAEMLIARDAASLPARIKTREALYGCNMAIRMSAAVDLRFDEALPLYGWQEDIDYTYQLGRRGRLISTGQVTGVHMGAKGGRTSGRKLGYSQVANIVYLRRKGTMQPGLGGLLLRKNIAANLIRSFRPEPLIDRRGRLIGNALALIDVIRGRVDPRRIEQM